MRHFVKLALIWAIFSHQPVWADSNFGSGAKNGKTCRHFDRINLAEAVPK